MFWYIEYLIRVKLDFERNLEQIHYKAARRPPYVPQYLRIIYIS